MSALKKILPCSYGCGFIGSARERHKHRCPLNHLSVEERFWSRVDKGVNGPDTCWLWTAGSTEYGKLKTNGETKGAHVVSYEIHSGEPVPDGVCVLHKCDTPRCVRFTHLFLGSKGDNNTDRANKGRSAPCNFPIRYGEEHWSKQKPELYKVVVELRPQTIKPGELFHIVSGHRRRAREVVCAHCSVTFLVDLGAPAECCSRSCASSIRAAKRWAA